MRTLTTITILALATVNGSTALAEGTWTFGALIDAETGIYVGQNDEASLLPYVSYESERFSFSLHDGLAYQVFEGDGPNGQTAAVSFVLSPRWAPDFGDDPLFDGLKRDTAIEAGVAGHYEAGLFFVDAEALIDISDTHKGHEVSAFAGVQYEVGAVAIEAGIGARYRNDDLSQHLFGVGTSEVNTARAAYAPGSTTSVFASVTALYAISDSLAVVGDITFEDLGDVDASPLVDKSTQTSVTFGMLYRF